MILPSHHCFIAFSIFRYILTLPNEFLVQGVEQAPWVCALEEAKPGVAQVAVGWLPTS